VQLTIWDNSQDDLAELFHLRDMYHPEDSTNSAYLARKD
jgi:hypothetical protein